MNCPICNSPLLWSDDRGAHCDGCDDFVESSLPPPCVAPPDLKESVDFINTLVRYGQAATVKGMLSKTAYVFLGRRERLALVWSILKSLLD